MIAQLVGCGAERSPLSVRPAGPPATSLTVPGTATSAPDMPAITLLFAMGEAERRLQSAVFEGHMYCRGGVGKKPKALTTLPGGEWEARNTYDAAFRRPAVTRIEVTAATNPAAVGMRLRVEGTQASVKMPGLLGALTIRKQLGDSEMLNFRGHRLDALSLGGLAKRFSGAADARLLGETVYDNHTLDLVEIPRGPAFDKAVTREVLGIDRLTHLPLLHAMYAGKQLVYELKLEGFAANVKVSEDQLKL